MTDRQAGVVAALEQAMPTEGDLDWLSRSIQRHTKGIDVWWEENRGEMSFRAAAKIIVSVWEAGRLKTDKVQQALGHIC